MSSFGAFSHLLFLFIFPHLIVGANSNYSEVVNGWEMQSSVGMEPMFGSETEGDDISEICALCTCCGGRGGSCAPHPCCYAINCNIPNRPKGYCAFTPKRCTCKGCNV